MRSLSLLAFLLFFFSLDALAAVPLPPETDEWITLTAGEFRVYSNASPNATRAIATNLLRMREALGKVTTLEMRAAKPTYVLVFRSKASFAPYRDAIFGKENAPVSGAFVSAAAGNFIAVDAAAEGGVAHVVYHELTHHFMRNTVPGLPLWLDEGLAEYYSTFSVRGDEVRVGYLIPAHVMSLRRREPLIPMERFFALDQQSPEFTDARRQKRFYAQAWALVHYFLAGGEARRARLDAFLDAIRAGRSAAEATAILGSDYPAMQQEIRSYVRRPSMTFTSYELDELVVPVPEAPRPAPRDAVLFALGAMLSSEALLAEAVRVNPSNAEALAVLGHVLEARGDDTGAMALFEKAHSLGSRDASMELLYREELVEREAAEVRVAERLVAEGKVAQGIAAMRAVIATTTDEDLKEHLRGVIGAHEDLAAREQQTTAMEEIIAAAKEGKTKEARSLIDALLAKTKDEPLRAQLKAMRRELERATP
jgi:tetratricopeptide (TPR) repeat protein